MLESRNFVPREPVGRLNHAQLIAPGTIRLRHTNASSRQLIGRDCLHIGFTLNQAEGERVNSDQEMEAVDPEKSSEVDLLIKTNRALVAISFANFFVKYGDAITSTLFK